MSDAWDGYRVVRRSSRRQKTRRRWRLAAVVLMLVAGSLVGLRLCHSQGVLPARTASAASASDGDGLAASALVIYNENDPLSRDLAAFYADKRGIPAERVVSLKCPIEEEISRQQYDDTIAGPLRAMFDERHWWLRSPDKPDAEPSSVVSGNRIRFLVLMRGIPLRIRHTGEPYPGDFCKLPSPIKDTNGASVDSELAVLGMFTRGIAGFQPNPYYRSFSRFADTHFPGIMLTGRLDAPTGSTVRQMILDSLAAEKNGLWGRCYLDGRGITPNTNPMVEGDQWIDRIASDRAPYFLPTITDRQPEMFPTAYPMNETAMYFGWYSQDVAGPFTREDFHFLPGAVAVHIHSFSATTLRDPLHYWVGPLINKGAAASLGNVYEPYLTLTTHLDIFADRLVRRVHPRGKRLGGDAGFVVDEHGRGRSALPARPVLEEPGVQPGGPPADGGRTGGHGRRTRVLARRANLALEGCPGGHRGPGEKRRAVTQRADLRGVGFVVVQRHDRCRVDPARVRASGAFLRRSVGRGPRRARRGAVPGAQQP